MPVPTETLWNTKKVNVVFAISSLALLGSMVWMVKVDYARPWRDTQNHFTDLQASLAYFDVLELDTEQNQEKLRNAEQALEGAKEALDAQQAEAAQLIEQFQDPDERAVAVEVLLESLQGEDRDIYLARARMIGDAFATLLEQQAESPDVDAFVKASSTPAIAEGVVSLLEWFRLDWLDGKVNEIRGEHAMKNIEQKNIKSELGVAVVLYEHEKGLHGEEHPATKEKLATLESLESRYAVAKVEYDRLQDLMVAIEEQKKHLTQDVTSAQRDLDAVVKERDDALKKYAEYGNTLTRGIYNMPLNDFLAPKGVRGRNEIKQVVLPDVRLELNFLQSYSVDRCMTCHVAIDDKNFTKQNLARELEEAIFAINDKLAKERRRLLTPPLIENREDIEAGGVAAAWETLTDAQRDTFFDAVVKEVNKFQKMEGRPELEFRQPLLAHPDLDLYVGSSSPHPMSSMGCTTCHEGNGEETDFVLAAHTPKSHEERHHWEEKYYVNTAGILPEQNFYTAEHHWERPMLLPQHVEAGCTKCHTTPTDIAVHEGEPAATVINEGRFLFENVGCVNCHLVAELEGSRRVGPDLSHVGEKLTRGFMHNWIWFPKDYRPSTWMPHYFEQENNDEHSERAADPEPVLRTRAEVVAMTEYLLAVSSEYEQEALPEALWTDDLKDEESDAVAMAADRGRRLFGSVGCLACHATLEYQANDEYGEPLAPLGERWIVNDIYFKMVDLAEDVQRGKARKIKKGIEDADVALGDIDAIEERLAVVVEGEDGGAISLEVLQAVFEESKSGASYDVAAAKAAAFKRILGVSSDDIRAVKLTDDDLDLLELSDDVLDAIDEFAFGIYESLDHVSQVEYAMANFADAYETMSDPSGAKGPIFTRFAPELSSIRTKFEDYESAVTWLYDWLKNPRHYSEYTKMPRMRLDRYEPKVRDPETGEEGDDTVAADEALDIAIYLTTLDANDTFSTDEFDSDDASAEELAGMRDELILTLLGGLNSAARSNAILSDEAGVMTEQLVSKLAGSMGEDEARARIEGMDLEQKQWVFLGDKVIGHYGCYACHKVRGYENASRPGTELTSWGEKLRPQLDFGFFVHEFEEERHADPLFRDLYPHDKDNEDNPGNRDKLIRWAHYDNPHADPEHTLQAFAWHKLRNPRMYDRKKTKGPYEKLKMPNFFLDAHQTDALVTFLLSRKPARVNPSLQVDYEDTPAGRVADGRALARELNCVGCHIIDGNKAVVHQYITRDEGGDIIFDEVNAPPWLRGQGAKVQGAWMYDFFTNVEMLRPWLKVRMPSFHLTNDQATALVEYFVGLSQHESEWLAKTVSPIAKYIAEAHGSAATDGDEEGDLAGADWYTLDTFSTQAQALREYAVQNRLVRDTAFDPEAFDADEWAELHMGIVRDASYIRDLYDVTFPFTEPSEYASSAHIADGETLFFELKCLACHVFGDPNVPGANAAPTAPNLQLTHRRLRRDWVEAWLDWPNRLQPGTKMPNVFGPGTQASAFVDYAPEQQEAVAKRLLHPGMIEDGAAQIDAMTSFLYAAGRAMENKIPPSVEAVEDGAAVTPEDAETPPASQPADGGSS